MYKLLKTHQISTGVIELIEASREICYLVTPYLKTWPLLDRVLEKAADQEKPVTLIVRAEVNRSRSATERLLRLMNEDYGFEVVILSNLHTKLYLSEKRAIISSMNLYDSSQERNYELAVEFTQRHMVQKIKQEVIDGDLLAVRPVEHRPGKFHLRQEQLREEMQALMGQFDARGFCVTCGTKIDLDRANLKQPYFVRCRPCYAREPEAASNAWTYNIGHCHFCGDLLQSVLTEPYHHACSAALRRYVDWSKLNTMLPVSR